MPAISLDSSPHPRASRRHPESQGINQGRLMRRRPSKGTNSHLSTTSWHRPRGPCSFLGGAVPHSISTCGSVWQFPPTTLTIPGILQLQLHQTSSQHGHRPLVFGCSRRHVLLHLMTPVLPIWVVLQHLCGQRSQTPRKTCELLGFQTSPWKIKATQGPQVVVPEFLFSQKDPKGRVIPQRRFDLLKILPHFRARSDDAIRVCSLT